MLAGFRRAPRPTPTAAASSAAGHRHRPAPRSFYAGRAHPKHEPQMHEDCIRHLRRRGWKMVAHEWIVVAGHEEYGRGDLVFQRWPLPIYLVIEAKRRHGHKVREQARFYGAAWKVQHAPPHALVAFGIWTIPCQEVLGWVGCHGSAARICWERFGRERLP